MRRAPLALLLWSAAHLAAFAEEPPDWLQAARGRPIPPEAAKADVVVLLKESLMDVTRSEARERVRYAMRVNTEAGLRTAVLMSGQRVGEEFKLVGGWKVRPDGVATRYDRKAIVQFDADASYEFSMTKVNALRPEGTRVGDILAWEYVGRSRPEAFQTTWYFGGDRPTLLSRFGVKTPEGWSVRHDLTHAVELTPGRDDEGFLVWEMRDVPALPDEPMRVPDEDLMPRLRFAYAPPEGKADARNFETWESVARWYAGVASAQVVSDSTIRKMGAQLAAEGSGPGGAIAAVARFTRSLRYLDTAPGRSVAEPHPAPAILANRFGDCEDKAILTITLLKEVGVEAWPLLVLTRDDGTIDPGFPGVGFFNHVIVALRPPEGLESAAASFDAGKAGRLIAFDPTASMTALGDLPFYLQGTRGVLAHPDKGGLVELPRLDAARSARSAESRLSFGADGLLQATTRVRHEGQYATEWRHHYESVRADRRAEEVTRRLSTRFGRVEVKRLEVAALDRVDEPLGVDLELSAKPQSPSASMRMVPVSFLLPTRASPLPGGSRRNPVLILESYMETERTALELPDGWSLVSKLPAEEAGCDTGTYRLAARQEGNSLVIERELRVKAGVLEPSGYEALRAFFDKVARADGGTVLLEKRAP